MRSEGLPGGFEAGQEDSAPRVAVKRRFGVSLLPSFADVFFLCIFLSISFSLPKTNSLLADGDTGYHIRAGEYAIQHLSVPRHDIFSFIAPPLPWTAHEWLSEIIMALIHSFSGLTGVVLFFAFLIAVEFALLFKMVQARSGNVYANLLIMIAVIGASQVHWLARPHIFSLLLMTLWYYVLDRYQRDDRNYLFILPLSIVLWVNLHGGFVAGPLLVGIYLAGNVLRSLRADGAGKTEARRRAKTLALLFVLCLAASLINPYGVNILSFPFKLTMNPFLMDHVDEFLSPDFHKQLMFKYFLLFTIVVLSMSRKKLNAIELMLILLFADMSLSSTRYIPLFCIIAAPILSTRTGEIIGRAEGPVAAFLRKRSEKLAAFDASLRSGVLPFVAVLAVLVLASLGDIHFEFDRKSKPVDAVEFMKREHIQGHMFNNDEFGDYIIYAAWPEYRVFFDGRSDMYGVEQMKEYFEVAGAKRDREKVLRKYDINWIIFNSDSALSAMLEGRTDWRLIYADPVAEIFVRNIPEYAALIAKYPAVKPVPRASKGKQADNG